MNGDAKRTLANLADAAEELKSAAEAGRNMVEGLQGPTTDFAANGLPQLTATVVQMQATVESLNRVIGEIEANPRARSAKMRAGTRTDAPAWGGDERLPPARPGKTGARAR